MFLDRIKLSYKVLYYHFAENFEDKTYPNKQQENNSILVG